MIHAAAGGKDLLRRAVRPRVPIREHKNIVIKFQPIHTDSLFLDPLDLFYHRDKIRRDLIAEGGDVAAVIAVSAKSVIAEADISFIAERSRLRRAVFHKLVIERIQRLPMGIEAFPLRRICRLSDCTVSALLVRRKLCQRQGLSVELYRHGRVKRLIFGRERIFLLDKADDLRLEGTCRDLKIPEKQLAEMCAKLRTKRRRKQLFLDRLSLFLHQRCVFIHEVVFRRIELVPRIDGMAHGSERGHSRKMLSQSVRLLISGNLLLRRFRIRKLLQDLVKFRKRFFHIRTFIWHFRKFHISSLKTAARSGYFFALQKREDGRGFFCPKPQHSLPAGLFRP